MDEIKYEGPERSIYEDPCLTCNNFGIKEDCLCEEYEEYIDAHINAIAEEDFT